MDAHEPAEDDVVFDAYVARDVGGVGEYAVVADGRIMRHVGVGHEQVVVPDGGGAAHRSRFTVANSRKVFHSPIVRKASSLNFQVLRIATDDGVGEDDGLLTDGRRAVDLT